MYCILYRTESVEESTSQAPVFTSSPKSVEVKEGQKAHFEARIIPVSDPTLRVEWFLNGQPIKQGMIFIISIQAFKEQNSKKNTIIMLLIIYGCNMSYIGMF